ncbi:Fimbrin [Wickerhamiella sorbophila]|uniref:Fimbrin n=1 Tax=Wickerhamiella sorbophila TaxID=45607 RepID=A0A2T0FDI0_9ASCO|nr:Fimbrin [Wickerhamiella sorbophila]PRT53063.1 Fimbrin [Wickerhamiella sorbophila]
MNVLGLQKRHPELTQEEVLQLVDEFQQIDVDDNGYVDKQTVVKVLSSNGRGSYDQIRETMKQVDVDSSGHVELEDFAQLISKLKEAKQAPKIPSKPSGLQVPGNRPRATSNSRIVVQGKSGAMHVINEEERTEFTRHINSVLAGDRDIDHLLPLPTDTNQIFDDSRDSLILSKLINDSVPDTIDTRVLNFPKGSKQLNKFQMAENANVVINSAKGIGCVVVNVHAEDIIDGKEHLILGLIWQIIRKGLLAKVDIKLHPELYRLLEEDETLEQFLRLPPEQILLRWFNYHLKAAGWDRRVNNFSSDVRDGENYTVLLNQLNSELCSRAPLKTRDLLERAEQVLQNADKLGARKYLTPTAMVAGNPKLNLSFVAHLFNTYPGLDPVTEEEKVDIEDFDAEGEREARVFTMWLNSLDVDPPVVSLFDDLRDGTVLLQAYDKVQEGTVNWRVVNKRPAEGEMMPFKAIENANYAVTLGKENGFSLVGIEGMDICDGNKTLTLGLVWQLMRRNIDLTLAGLAKNGKTLSDSEILKWAHEKIRKGNKSTTVRSFKDASLADGRWLLDVIHGIKPEYVDYDLVGDDAYDNAKLAISVARKLGALIWLVPEDINEVRSRLILTFVASLMSLEK